MTSVPESILALLIDGAIAGILLLFYFLRKRAKEIPKKILEKKPEKKPAPAAPAKRGIPGYLKTVIILIIALAVIGIVWTQMIPKFTVPSVSVPTPTLTRIGDCALPTKAFSKTELSKNSWQIIAPATAGPLNPVKTGIYLSPKQKVTINATGEIQGSINCADGASPVVGPNGWLYEPDFNKGRTKVLQDAPFMALLGRIGNSSWFKINSGAPFTPNVAGELQFTYNDATDNPQWFNDNGGYITAVISK